jgi:hypothetical protein
LLAATLVLSAGAMQRPDIVDGPRSELEAHNFRELVLIKTFDLGHGHRWACLVVLPKRQVEVANVGSYIGGEETRIVNISERHIVLEEMKLLNGDEWIVNKFTWPITENKIPSAEEKSSRHAPMFPNIDELARSCKTKIVYQRPSPWDFNHLGSARY